MQLDGLLCPRGMDRSCDTVNSGGLEVRRWNGISKGNRMKTWHKVAIGAGSVVVLGGIVLFSVSQANKGVVTVQTAKVATQDSLVSLVTASGEVKPTTYTNVTAQGFGRIIEILVKEGDHAKKGDRLLLQENIQASAYVQAQAASINSAEAGAHAAEASDKAAQADLISQQANLE